MSAVAMITKQAITGTLHVFLALDWGDEILLDQARQLVPAESLVLLRRRRTPTWFSYQPAPLYLALDPITLPLAEIGKVEVRPGLTLFDFAAVSVAVRVPFSLTEEQLRGLASTLAEPTQLIQGLQAAVRPLYERLQPAIREPSWSEGFLEEYFVFQFPHDPPVAAEGKPLASSLEWVANLVHLESGGLSQEESSEALRLRLSYSRTDLLIVDWAAAALFDRECDETLQALEFANLQLVEFRSIDQRLDKSLAEAEKLIRSLTQTWLPFWRLFGRPLRRVGEFKVEANHLFERTGNALKLVGDPYLARAYRLASARFHLETWEQSILRKLSVAEGIYQVVATQAGAFRTEFLEALIVLLIVIEIVLAFFR
jgi:hypothetical protein